MGASLLCAPGAAALGAIVFTLTAIVVALSAFVMVFVTAADLLVAWLDPRARIAASVA